MNTFQCFVYSNTGINGWGGGIYYACGHVYGLIPDLRISNAMWQRWTHVRKVTSSIASQDTITLLPGVCCYIMLLFVVGVHTLSRLVQYYTNCNYSSALPVAYKSVLWKYLFYY